MRTVGTTTVPVQKEREKRDLNRTRDAMSSISAAENARLRHLVGLDVGPIMVESSLASAIGER